jgi:hypothetical protein
VIAVARRTAALGGGKGHSIVEEPDVLLPEGLFDVCLLGDDVDADPDPFDRDHLGGDYDLLLMQDHIELAFAELVGVFGGECGLQADLIGRQIGDDQFLAAYLDGLGDRFGDDALLEPDGSTYLHGGGDRQLFL